MLLDPKEELCWPPTTSLLTAGLPMIFRAFWVLFHSSWGNFGAIGPLLKFLYVFINLNTKASLSGGGRGEKRTFSPGICACISEDHVTTSSLLLTESYLIARAFKEKKKKRERIVSYCSLQLGERVSQQQLWAFQLFLSFPQGGRAMASDCLFQACLKDK